MSMLVPNLEELVPEAHLYREFLRLVNFEQLCNPLRARYSDLGRAGYPVATGFKCLLVQFMEDLSDRQMELRLKDSL